MAREVPRSPPEAFNREERTPGGLEGDGANRGADGGSVARARGRHTASQAHGLSDHLGDRSTALHKFGEDGVSPSGRGPEGDLVEPLQGSGDRCDESSDLGSLGASDGSAAAAMTTPPPPASNNHGQLDLVDALRSIANLADRLRDDEKDLPKERKL